MADREQRIADRIVVDAYTAEEQAMGWYYYLQEQLAFPFKVTVGTALPTSPLRAGDCVRVIAMASEAHCTRNMLVWVLWKTQRLAVPLTQLIPITTDENTVEAMADWQYWVGRGYGG